jgi:hypothetical protein
LVGGTAKIWLVTDNNELWMIRVILLPISIFERWSETQNIKWTPVSHNLHHKNLPLYPPLICLFCFWNWLFKTWNRTLYFCYYTREAGTNSTLCFLKCMTSWRNRTDIQNWTHTENTVAVHDVIIYK